MDFMEMDIKKIDLKKINFLQYEQLYHALPRNEQNELRVLCLQNAKSQGIVNIYQDLQMHSQYVEAHRDLTPYDGTVQLHSHSFYELLYCCQGKTEYLLGTKRHQVQKGDLIIIPPGLSHRPLISREQKEEPYERIAIWLSADFADSCKELWTDISAGHILHSDSGNWNFLHDYFTRIYLESIQQRKAYESIACGNALALMGLLSRALSSETNTEMKNSDLLDNVIHYIETHISEKIALEDTANHFFISQSTLSKLFRSRLNESFYQFVTQRRLIAAKQLIERGLPLTQIGEQVGFCDYAAFYRAFRREYGLSPTKYRSLLCAKKASCQT